MLVFEVRIKPEPPEEIAPGQIRCFWQEDSWLAGIRAELRAFQHNTLAELKASKPDFALPSDDEIERGLDEDVKRVREIAAELAPRIFGMAQATLLREVMIRYLQETGLFRSQDKVLVRDMRNETTSFAQKLYNESLGIRRGREAGQKISKRSEALEHREKILTAMREVYKSDPLHDPQRKRVAPMLGIGIRQLGNWMKEITRETGETWEDLIVEATQKRKFKKIFFWISAFVASGPESPYRAASSILAKVFERSFDCDRKKRLTKRARDKH